MRYCERGNRVVGSPASFAQVKAYMCVGIQRTASEHVDICGGGMSGVLAS
jgi:hypothetical protein